MLFILDQSIIHHLLQKLVIEEKSRVYILTVIDQDSPYIVPTQFESFSGLGGKSFNNILRYQNIINPNIQVGALATKAFIRESYAIDRT